MMTEKSVADVLSEAADLIEPEGAWTQGASARDLHGQSTETLGDQARCFCVIGAISKISGKTTWYKSSPQGFFDSLVPEHWNNDLCAAAVWNDATERTQAEVVAKLREAAALAREQGK